MFSSADKQFLDRQLTAIIARYSSIDDAVYLLTTNQAQIKILIDQYGGEVQSLIGKISGSSKFAEMIRKAQGDFAKNLQQSINSGKFSYQPSETGKLLESVINSFRNRMNATVDNTTSNLFAKATHFTALSEALKIPAERLKQIGEQGIESVTIGGNTYRKQQIVALWDRMNQSYGQRDTIQYRNGANYPLRSYLDGRLSTTQAETHRTVTQIEAAANGIYFGTTNKTGTTDSCVYHEDEIFFLNDAAREEALAQWPDEPTLKDMATYDEIANDDTHMFKFNCEHIVRPIPLQFYSESKFTAAIEDKPPADVPDKIDERQVFENVTGRPWVDDSKNRTPSYSDIPGAA